MTTPFQKQYNEEGHLFNVVGPRFRAQGYLDAYDLFFIVRWKANRAISTVAKSLARVSRSDLQVAAKKLTSELYEATQPRSRFLLLADKWKMRLPMSSAILTVLYPEDFTVYDVRVCNRLGNHHNLVNRVDSERRWRGYLEYQAAVKAAVEVPLSLRDKDRYLWAQSRHEDLLRFVERSF
jgi:hypothetical protein